MLYTLLIWTGVSSLYEQTKNQERRLVLGSYRSDLLLRRRDERSVVGKRVDRKHLDIGSGGPSVDTRARYRSPDINYPLIDSRWLLHGLGRGRAEENPTSRIGERRTRERFGVPCLDRCDIPDRSADSPSRGSSPANHLQCPYYRCT